VLRAAVPRILREELQGAKQSSLNEPVVSRVIHASYNADVTNKNQPFSTQHYNAKKRTTKTQVISTRHSTEPYHLQLDLRKRSITYDTGTFRLKNYRKNIEIK